MSTAISVRGLRLHYGDVVALDGVDLDLPGDRIYGLIGRNGSGKTSLLSVLAAFRPATAGEVLVGGEPVFENPRATRNVCLIREAGDTNGSDTVKDTLGFAACLRPRWDGEFAESLVERFRLPLKRRVNGLSRGQRSALGIVVGLASRAPVTMFDESYLGMDAPSRYTFYDVLLADFMANPRTIVVSTHLIEEIGRLFDEVVIIDRGRIVLHEDAETVRSRGVAVTGPAAAVDEFVSELAWFAGATVLGERQLGPTKSVTIYGALDDSHRARAAAANLELGPIGLQDLFVHLTTGGER